MKALSLLIAVLAVVVDRCTGQELVKDTTKVGEAQLTTNVTADFSCVNRTRDMYFPDPASGCQKFHLCTKAEGNEILNLSFMCPQGTSFDVKSADCQSSETVVCQAASSGNDTSAAVGALGPRSTRKVNNQIGKHKFKVAPPNTSFKCGSKKLGHYYADVETGCTVFHLCTVGNYKTEVLDFQFMCVEGTTFDETQQQCTPTTPESICGSERIVPATSTTTTTSTTTEILTTSSSTTAAPTTTTTTTIPKTKMAPEPDYYDAASLNITDGEPVFYEYEEQQDPQLPADEHVRERRGAAPVNIQSVVSLVRTKRAPPPSYNLDQLPTTSFSCQGKVPGGYYADVETGCQLYHVCSGDANSGMQNFKFLCINGTIFSQQTRTCQAWYTVNCESTPQFTALNDDLSQFVPEAEVAVDPGQQQFVQDEQTPSRQQQATPIRVQRPLQQSESPARPSAFSDNLQDLLGHQQGGVQSQFGFEHQPEQHAEPEQQQQQHHQPAPDNFNAAPQFVSRFPDVSNVQPQEEVTAASVATSSSATKRRGRKRGGRRRKQRPKTTTTTESTLPAVEQQPQNEFVVDSLDQSLLLQQQQQQQQQQSIQDSGIQSPQISTLTSPHQTFAIQEQIPGLLEEIQVRGRFQQTEEDFGQDFLRNGASQSTRQQQQEFVARQPQRQQQQEQDQFVARQPQIQQQQEQDQFVDRPPQRQQQQEQDQFVARQPPSEEQFVTRQPQQFHSPRTNLQQEESIAIPQSNTFQEPSAPSSSQSQGGHHASIFDGFDSFIQTAIADEQEQRARLAPILERQRQEQLERQRQDRLEQERDERARQEKRTKTKQARRKRPKTTTTTTETPVPQFLPQFSTTVSRPAEPIFRPTFVQPTTSAIQEQQQHNQAIQQQRQIQAQLQQQIQQQLQQQQQSQLFNLQRQHISHAPFFTPVTQRPVVQQPAFAPAPPPAFTFLPAPQPSSPFQQTIRQDFRSQQQQQQTSNNLQPLFLQQPQTSSRSRFVSATPTPAQRQGSLSDLVFLVPAESEQQLSRSVFHRGISIDGEQGAHLLSFDSPGSSGFELHRTRRASASFVHRDTPPLDFLKLVGARTPDYPDSPFTCRGKVVGGYYADVHTGCNMFHVCSIGRKKGLLYDFRFLCGNDTLFDQRSLTCNSFDKVACELSHKYYPQTPLPEEPFDETVPHAELFKVRVKRAVVGVEALGPNDYPATAFTCGGRDANKYYADPETNCELFHLCTEVSPGKGLVDYRFLCKNGTVFDQRAQACEDQTDLYNCQDDPTHYGIGETFSRTQLK